MDACSVSLRHDAVGILGFELGAKNCVPELVAHSKPIGGILVVMQHVVFLQTQQNGVLEGEMMQGIVPNVITQIADHKTGEERGDQLGPQDDAEQPMKTDRDRNAERNGHHQPIAVAWEIVVHAMSNEVDALAQLARRAPMEYETVKCVFREGPHEHAQHKERNELPKAHAYHPKAQISEIDEYRYEHEEWHGPVHAREDVDELVLEHRWTLVPIVYEVLCHGYKSIGYGNDAMVTTIIFSTI